MARIYSRHGKGKAIYYIDYILHGQRIRKRVGTRKRLAEYALADIIAKTERQELGLSTNPKKIADFSREYLAWCEKNKPDSLEKEKRVIRNFSSLIKHSRVSEITEQDIEKYKNIRKDQAVKDSTINRELNVLKAMLNKAASWKYIPVSPAKNVKKFRTAQTSFRYLTREEIERVFQIAKGKMKSIILTYLYTGLRRNELIYLDWSDVNIKNKILSVSPKENWHPKDYEIRHIPINGNLLSCLEKLRSGFAGCIFVNRNGNRYLPTALSREVSKVFRKAGIKNADIRTLRHTYASHLVMSGVDLYTVQKLLGHSSIRTTERYAHLAPDFLRGAAESLKF